MTARIPPPAHRRGRRPLYINIRWKGVSRRLLDRSKNAILPTHLHLAPPLGVIPSEFRRDLLGHKIRVYGHEISRPIEKRNFCLILRRCFRDPTFSYFAYGTTPACDGQTDGQTKGHSILYRASKATRVGKPAHRFMYDQSNKNKITTVYIDFKLSILVRLEGHCIAPS